MRILTNASVRKSHNIPLGGAGDEIQGRRGAYDFRKPTKCTGRKELHRNKPYLSQETKIRRAGSVLLALYELTYCLLDELVIRK